MLTRRPRLSVEPSSSVIAADGAPTNVLSEAPEGDSLRTAVWQAPRSVPSTTFPRALEKRTHSSVSVIAPPVTRLLLGDRVVPLYGWKCSAAPANVLLMN